MGACAVTLYDALVMGAGPAGSIAARELARGGWRVLLVEREAPGRDRVCGGFLGPEMGALWHALDFDRPLAEVPGACIEQLVLSEPRGAQVEARLPGNGGWGVHRADFDAWLAGQAAAAGATVWPRTQVARLQRQGAGTQATLVRANGACSVYARVVVRATGRRPAAAGVPQGAAAPLFGCKTVYAGLAGLERCVALHFVPGGHVGFNQLPDGRATMCLVLDRARLAAARGRLDELMARLGEDNPAIARHLRGAQRTAPWIGCPVAPDARQRFFEHGEFFVGDAAAVLDPIVGGGLSVAMGSAVLLARQLLTASPRATDVAVAARRYARSWQAAYAGRVRLSRWLGRCERSAWVSRAILQALSRCPGTMEQLVRATRPRLRAA